MNENENLGLRHIRRALISVSDKTGIVDFARELKRFDVQLISTGGTAVELRNAGIAVNDVSDITGFPEMMDGRVKTLHPLIHGALLGVRDNPEHLKAMNERGIEPIDMVVVNLYPFEQTIARNGVTFEEAIEQIDIGGPAMIRSAAKNWKDVVVINSTGDYANVVEELIRNDGAVSSATRRRLAQQAFMRTSAYDLKSLRFWRPAIKTKRASADSIATSRLLLLTLLRLVSANSSSTMRVTFSEKLRRVRCQAVLNGHE